MADLGAMAPFNDEYTTADILERMRPASPGIDQMREIAKWLQENADQPGVKAKLVPLLMSALGGGMETAANWIEGRPEIGPDTIAPLGLAAVGGMMAPRGALGAMGGGANRMTAEDVANLMRSLNYERVRVDAPKTGNTLYVRGEPPGNPPRSGADTPTVRVPDDGHLGRPASGGEVGNRYDTGSPDAERIKPINKLTDHRPYRNAGGDLYADPEALEGVLKWRRGDLVSPDQAPSRTKLAKDARPEQTPREPEGGPINHPDQIQLLTAALTAPLIGGLADTGEAREHPEKPPGERPAEGTDDLKVTPRQRDIIRERVPKRVRYAGETP